MAPRKKRHRVKKKLSLLSILKSRFFWIALLTVILLAGTCYFLFFSHFFQIRSVLISGNQEVREDKIREVVEPLTRRELRLGPFSILRTRSLFLISPYRIRQNLFRAYPPLREVKVRRGLPDSLQIEVEERQPFAELCGPDGDCYRVDKEGIAFKQSASLKKEEEGMSVVRIEREGLNLILKEAEEIELGKEVVDPLYLKKTLEIKKRLETDLEQSPKQFSLSETSHLVVQSDQGFSIHFDLEEDTSDQLFNLELVLKEKISEEKIKGLEYIDLRFGNRVYYK